MSDEKNEIVKVPGQGYLRLKITTAMIFAGIIFLASLFSGWLTQTKDIGSVQAEHKILTSTVNQNSNRITIVEQCIISLKEDTKEMKETLKEIQKDQKGFYSRMDKKGILPK